MFKERSLKTELLDEPNIPSHDLFQNLKELNIINSYLGGHSISIKGLIPIVKNGNTIADIGCGGGDNLNAIARYFKNRTSLNLIGIDLKRDCIEYAKDHCKQHKNIEFFVDDFRNIFETNDKIDVVHAALFCHHFTKDQIVDFIKICKAQNVIFVINDLQRNFFAYYGIKILTRLFSKSYLVKNDAPISVLRGFKRSEWIQMIREADCIKFSIKYKWAFRYLVTIYS